MHLRHTLRHAGVAALLVGAGALGCATAVGELGAVRDAGAVREACAATQPAGQVRWVGAAEPADWAPLDAWCAGVGGAVVRGPAPHSAHAPVDSLVVVTWNTHIGGGDIVAFVRDLAAGRWTGGRPVTHFALLLQEVHRGGGTVPAMLPAHGKGADRIAHGGESVPDVVAIAERLGLALLYVPSMRNGTAADEPDEDRGNAILATLPLVDPAGIELPYEAQRRVAAAAAVQGIDRSGTPWALHLTSMHLDTRSRLARGLASLGAGRGRQARAVVDALAAEATAVVGGDLNTWSLDALEDAPHILRRAFPDAPAQGEATFVAAGLLPRRLDHLYFRGKAATMTAPVRVDARYGSDHYPVLAWVALRVPTATHTAAR